MRWLILVLVGVLAAGVAAVWLLREPASSQDEVTYIGPGGTVMQVSRSDALQRASEDAGFDVALPSPNARYYLQGIRVSNSSSGSIVMVDARYLDGGPEGPVAFDWLTQHSDARALPPDPATVIGPDHRGFKVYRQEIASNDAITLTFHAYPVEGTGEVHRIRLGEGRSMADDEFLALLDEVVSGNEE